MEPVIRISPCWQSFAREDKMHLALSSIPPAMPVFLFNGVGNGACLQLPGTRGRFPMHGSAYFFNFPTVPVCMVCVILHAHAVLGITLDYPLLDITISRILFLCLSSALSCVGRQHDLLMEQIASKFCICMKWYLARCVGSTVCTRTRDTAFICADIVIHVRWSCIRTGAVAISRTLPYMPEMVVNSKLQLLLVASCDAIQFWNLNMGKGFNTYI